MNRKWSVLQNQRGVSLVELLAVISLASLISIVIWTTLSVSTRLNTTEITKLRLQQETNYIATEAQRLHRYCSNYEFVVMPRKIEIQNCLNSTQTFQDFVISTNYLYYTDEKDPNDIQESFYINSKKENLEITNLWVVDPNNINLKISVPLELSRYKQSP